MRTIRKVLIWTITLWVIGNWGNSRDPEIEGTVTPDISIPVTPESPIDTTLIHKRDTTPYKGNWVDPTN